MTDAPTILLAGTGFSALPQGPWNVGDVAQATALAARIRTDFPNARLLAVPPDPRHVGRVPGVDLAAAPAAYLSPDRLDPRALRYARRAARSLSLIARTRPGGDRWIGHDRGGARDALEELGEGRALVLCGMGDLCDGFAHLGAARWGVPAAVASRLGIPVFASGQQVGPLERPDARAVARWAIRSMSVVGVRDPRSGEVARSLGASRGRVVFTGDDAWDLPSASAGTADDVLAGVGVEGPFVAVNARLAPWTRLDAADVSSLASLLDAVSSTIGLPLVFVPMLSGPGGDGDGAERLRALVRAPSAAVPEPLEPSITKALLGRAELTLGTGYHACLLAASAGTPALGLYRSAYMRQKMRALPFLAPGTASAHALRATSQATLLEAARRVMDGSAQVPARIEPPRPERVNEALAGAIA